MQELVTVLITMTHFWIAPWLLSEEEVLLGTGQQFFLNNSYQYAVGDFPLSHKDYTAALRCVTPFFRLKAMS